MGIFCGYASFSLAQRNWSDWPETVLRSLPGVTNKETGHASTSDSGKHADEAHGGSGLGRLP
jgi:hypothetical protein